MARLATQEVDCKRAGPEFSRDTYELFTVTQKSRWSQTCVWVVQRHRETLYTTSDHETHFSASKPKGQNQAGSHLWSNPKRATACAKAEYIVELTSRLMLLFGFGRKCGRLWNRHCLYYLCMHLSILKKKKTFSGL